MKIIRKLFTRTYKNLEPFKIPKEWDGLYDTVETDLTFNQKFWNKEMSSLGDLEKNRAKELKKELLSDPFYLFNDGKLKDEYTHSLNDKSTSQIQVWSKDISLLDRLLYDVSKPILDKSARKVFSSYNTKSI